MRNQPIDLNITPEQFRDKCREVHGDAARALQGMLRNLSDAELAAEGLTRDQVQSVHDRLIDEQQQLSEGDRAQS